MKNQFMIITFHEVVQGIKSDRKEHHREFFETELPIQWVEKQINLFNAGRDFYEQKELKVQVDNRFLPQPFDDSIYAKAIYRALSFERCGDNLHTQVSKSDAIHILNGPDKDAQYDMNVEIDPSVFQKLSFENIEKALSVWITK